MTTTNQLNFERIYPVPPDVLFAAVKSAISDGPYKSPSADDFTRSVRYGTKATLTSYALDWAGQVTTDQEGAKLRLTGTSKKKLLAEGARPMKLAEALFADVSRRASEAIVS